MITNNSTMLFQGDSITDCGRSRDTAANPNDLNALGQGYAKMAASELLSSRPSDGLQIFNRGISGNRIVDLYARIKCDITNLKPDVLSILIGVNDTWHGMMSNNGVEVPKFERIYRALLDEVREELPNIKLVLCEPFVLPCGVVAQDWIPDINERRAVVARLAQDYHAVLVPFQSLFDDAMKKAPAAYWAADGVHPSAAGHMLMAKCWLEKTAGL